MAHRPSTLVSCAGPAACALNLQLGPQQLQQYVPQTALPASLVGTLALNEDASSLAAWAEKMVPANTSFHAAFSRIRYNATLNMILG
jgi:hypothetical protein